MTIYANSRYANQSVIRVLVDGATYPTVYRQVPGLAKRFLHYTAKAGDRYDVLAARYYGDSTLWWVIADANPEIPYPTNLPLGRVIRIPQR